MPTRKHAFSYGNVVIKAYHKLDSYLKCFGFSNKKSTKSYTEYMAQFIYSTTRRGSLLNYLASEILMRASLTLIEFVLDDQGLSWVGAGGFGRT